MQMNQPFLKNEGQCTAMFEDTGLDLVMSAALSNIKFSFGWPTFICDFIRRHLQDLKVLKL